MLRYRDELLLAVLVCRILREGDHLWHPAAHIDQCPDRDNRRPQRAEGKLRGRVPSSVQHVMDAAEKLRTVSCCAYCQNTRVLPLRKFCHFCE